MLWQTQVPCFPAVSRFWLDQSFSRYFTMALGRMTETFALIAVAFLCFTLAASALKKLYSSPRTGNHANLQFFMILFGLCFSFLILSISLLRTGTLVGEISGIIILIFGIQIFLSMMGLRYRLLGTEVEGGGSVPSLIDLQLRSKAPKAPASPKTAEKVVQLFEEWLTAKSNKSTLPAELLCHGKYGEIIGSDSNLQPNGDGTYTNLTDFTLNISSEILEVPDSLLPHIYKLTHSAYRLHICTVSGCSTANDDLVLFVDCLANLKREITVQFRSADVGFLLRSPTPESLPQTSAPQL